MPFYRFLEPLAFFSIISALFLTVPSYATFDQDIPNPCLDAVPVALDGTTRSFDFPDHASQYIRVDVPSAGLLSVSTSSFDAVSLAIVGAECGSDTSRSLTVIERSAVHLVMHVRQTGSYMFRIDSDPLAPIRQTKMRTAFVPEAPSAVFAKVGEDEEEIEIEPETLIDPGPAANDTLHSKLQLLCHKGEVDDHSDVPNCATFLTLGQFAAGELNNGNGDDEDMFTFVVDGSGSSNPRPVEIVISSEGDIVGGLYDHRGQHLEMTANDAEAQVRIFRSLEPGTYFVRVASRQGGAGYYALSVDTSR